MGGLEREGATEDRGVPQRTEEWTEDRGVEEECHSLLGFGLGLELGLGLGFGLYLAQEEEVVRRRVKPVVEQSVTL